MEEAYDLCDCYDTTNSEASASDDSYSESLEEELKYYDNTANGLLSSSTTMINGYQLDLLEGITKGNGETQYNGRAIRLRQVDVHAQFEHHFIPDNHVLVDWVLPVLFVALVYDRQPEWPSSDIGTKIYVNPNSSDVTCTMPFRNRKWLSRFEVLAERRIKATRINAGPFPPDDTYVVWSQGKIVRMKDIRCHFNLDITMPKSATEGPSGQLLLYCWRSDIGGINAASVSGYFATRCLFTE